MGVSFGWYFATSTAAKLSWRFAQSLQCNFQKFSGRSGSAGAHRSCYRYRSPPRCPHRLPLIPMKEPRHGQLCPATADIIKKCRWGKKACWNRWTADARCCRSAAAAASERALPVDKNARLGVFGRWKDAAAQIVGWRKADYQGCRRRLGTSTILSESYLTQLQLIISTRLMETITFSSLPILDHIKRP